METHSSILACLGNPKDRGAWRATVHGVTKESDMAYRLNNKYVLHLAEPHRITNDFKTILTYKNGPPK